MDFVDRILKCIDCSSDFVFTAGEQLFFFDRQFKNDPKRCKLCKAKRAGLGRSAAGEAVAALPLSRTETRTHCSSCGVDTTVPFKPTQGRPVFCRSCFQLKRVPAAAVAKAAGITAPAESEPMPHDAMASPTMEPSEQNPAASLLEAAEAAGVPAEMLAEAASA